MMMMISFVIITLMLSVGETAFHWDRMRHSLHQHAYNKNLNNDLWFQQKLDHFDNSDQRTWKQRYFINDKYYKAGGPIFLMIGGEGAANPVWMTEGTWIDYAKRMGALCLYLEHRFYGKSHPTTDMSVKNLKYLSSEQALEDLAHFVTTIKQKLGLAKNPLVAFGGSYPGSLAAWFRLKYPHLVVGSVATSAPLRAELNFKEYLGVVRDALKSVDDKCVDAITSGIKHVQLLVKHRLGWQSLTQAFRLCEPLKGDNSKDVSSLFEAIAGNFEGVVQYNRDNRDFEGAKGTNITIETLCDIMNNGNHTPLDRLAEVNSLMLQTYDEKCLDYTYKSFLKTYSATSWNSSASEGGRQWMYQTCTEFGWFQTSDLSDQPFGHNFPIELSLAQCQDVFGQKFSFDELIKGINHTNEVYGGLSYKGSRVLFPNGSIDPWHVLSVLKDLSPSTKAIYIQGTAHCANMYPSSPRDLPELKEARTQIEKEIKLWLS